MRSVILILALMSTLSSCSNTPELETGEIKTLQLLKKAITQSNKSNIFIDSRSLLSRKQIDASNIPILFVELKSGQNGTLTPYPGQGIGETWLGADGATITMEQGILKASRGMGDDLMGSSSSMLPWSKINNSKASYERKLNYLTGDNRIYSLSLNCTASKINKKEVIKIWDVEFRVNKYEEICFDTDVKIKNIYYVDSKDIVRKSLQYHSSAIGYITTERLDR